MAKKVKREKIAKTQKQFDTILALDMGSKNLAYCVMRNKKIVHLNFFENTITNLIDPYYNLDLRKFNSEFLKILKTFKPNAIIAERFQNRARFRGNSSELLNIMIGLISQIAFSKRIYVYLATASTWKNQFNKQFANDTSTILVNKQMKGKLVQQEVALGPLDTLYNSLAPFPDHLVDASLQAHYLAHLWEKNQYSTYKKTTLKKFAKEWRK